MTHRSASQNERVLAQLRKGPLDAVDFQPPNVCDGGKPVLRVAARIGVLRDRGFVILSERRRDGSARYRLVGEPERALSETQDPTAHEPPEQAAAEGGSQPVAHCEEPGAPDAAPGAPSPSPAEEDSDDLEEPALASEGVRSAAPAESHPGGSLFDASVFAERGGYENTEAA